MDRFRGSGRGGQKRNTTESAVRVTLAGTGITGCSDDTRSQTKNLAIALRRLRKRAALRLRCEPPGAWEGRLRPGRRDGAYPLWVAAVLDVLHAADYRLADAAARMGSGTGRVVRELSSDTELWQAVNEGRRLRGLSQLRAP